MGMLRKENRSATALRKSLFRVGWFGKMFLRCIVDLWISICCYYYNKAAQSGNTLIISPFLIMLMDCALSQTVALTSKLKERTTSDLESWFSFSSPMSMMDVLWLRFSFWSLNSEPPFDTGMLSKFAISRLTEDLSSSMYMFSISLDTNFGNLRSCSQTKSLFKDACGNTFYTNNLQTTRCCKSNLLKGKVSLETSASPKGRAYYTSYHLCICCCAGNVEMKHLALSLEWIH